MPVPSFRILVVCTGNICRSPLAERLLRTRLDARLGEDGPQVVVGSAGARGLDRSPMDRHAAAELRRLGGDPDEFSSRPLTDVHVTEADLVLTATREHRSAVLSRFPEALRRTFTLLEFAALAPYRPLPDAVPGDILPSLVQEAAQRRASAASADHDIPDPYTRARDVHREVADLIGDAVERIVTGLVEARSRSI